ncbi:Uncharacterised protein [Legionella pneumophila]|nr:Uncharacterised protein [Legionella pneumophila]CZH55166.1 Uncharacterised protein [Legionella pneumophila]
MPSRDELDDSVGILWENLVDFHCMTEGSAYTI